jgi:NhaB family Na+:H+ antiporter
MPKTIAVSFLENFLGNAAAWYKLTIILFLILNPIVLVTLGSFVAGWLLEIGRAHV